MVPAPDPFPSVIPGRRGSIRAWTSGFASPTTTAGQKRSLVRRGPLGSVGTVTTTGDGVPEGVLKRLRGASRGSRWVRVALQLNPYAYCVRYDKAGAELGSEEAYNKGLVQSLLDHGVKGVAITDHDEWASGAALADACRSAGIEVLPGVEVVAQGVHVLCIFGAVDPLQRFLGWWATEQKCCKLVTLLEKADNDADPFLAMPAHIDSDAGGGLLNAAVGERASMLGSPHLHAVAANQPLSAMSASHRGVLENARLGGPKAQEAPCHRPLALVSANDVCHPDDVAKPAATCLVRVDRLNLTGLRWALTDPDSRLRAHGAQAPSNLGARAVTWEGGYLDGQVCGLSDGLTCLVGGRGSGKSTVIESLRLALGISPGTDDARRRQQIVIEHVLGEGTRISLLLDTDDGLRVVVCTVGEGMQGWFDVRGRPVDPVAVTGVEVYGQHELADLAEDAQGRTRLLRRFLANIDPVEIEVKESQRLLAELSARLEREELSRDELAEQTALIPELEERLAVLRASGINEAASDFSRAESARVHFDAATSRIRALQGALDRFVEESDVSLALPPAADEADPVGRALVDLRTTLLDLQASLGAMAGDARTAIDAADRRLAEVKGAWDAHREAARKSYDALLRSLDAPEGPRTFVQLERDLTRLRSLLPSRDSARKRAVEVARDRVAALVQFRRARARRLETLKLARERANAVAGPEVQVSVEADTDLEPLWQVLRDEVGGRLSETIERLRSWDEPLAVETFVAWCRRGPADLAEALGITVGQAERICGPGERLFRRLEAVDLVPVTRIKLRVGTEGGRDVLRGLDEGLSTGQRATALLRLLLAEVDSGPLVVDQPEDDLDNAFVHDQVVRDLRREKHRRQIIVATHNANIPVLGDAEMVNVLAPSGPNRGEVKESGGLDLDSVRNEAARVLEGGRDALRRRFERYGFTPDPH